MSHVRLASIFVSVSLWFAGAQAQPLSDPAPLVEGPARAGEVGWVIDEARALRAMQAGFPATAVAIQRAILSNDALPADARARVTLALVTALMDSGDVRGAEAALAGYGGPRDSAYHLRAGLLASNARRTAQARAELSAVREEELAPADRGWWLFLRAEIAESENNIAEANGLFDQAVQAAVSQLQRSRFLLGQAQTILRSSPPGEQQLATWRTNMEQLQGTRQGYVWARTYATGLHALRRSTEATAVLQRQLALLPATERETADQFRLVLGLIAGETSVEGRRAFRELLRDGLRPDTQRTALHLLARGAQNRAERAQLRLYLSELIAAPAQHPITEDMLVVSAQTALADNLLTDADADARALLERFPGSPLRSAALGLRLAVAWEEKRFRAAADLIRQLREEIEAGRERSELGVLLAEAYFRAGADAVAGGSDGKPDFRNAADAYEAALREAPAVVPAGTLIFQRVLAEIRSDRLDVAAGLLDEMAVNPSLDPVNRWRAEWNLEKELQARGESTQALARVTRLLETGRAGVPAELRVRLMWLQAKLSFDSAQTENTLRLTEALLGALPGMEGIDAAVLSNVASNAQLLKSRALLSLGRDAEGTAALEELRSEHRRTPAAIYSYIVQAGRLAQTGKLADAQKVLTDLADANKESEFAPLALFEAALNAERQGLDRNLQEAYNLLERINRDYPQDELRFYGLVKQGDLLRKLNDFSAARQVYEYVLNNYPQHPEVLLAQLALADTLFALGANSVVNYESATALFERLRDLPSAPVDLRVEAGYKWGYAVAKRKLPERAQAVLWSVVDAFLLDPQQSARLGSKGRYWMARVLLELGQLHEDAGRLDEAQRAYRLIVDYNLGPGVLARDKLQRYQAAGAEARP